MSYMMCDELEHNIVMFALKVTIKKIVDRAAIIKRDDFWVIYIAQKNFHEHIFFFDENQFE